MQTLDQHIMGLRKNIHQIQNKIDEMHGEEFCPPHNCCPACYWGSTLTDAEDALQVRLDYLDVLLCRKAGLKPKKVRTVKIKVECCPAPHKTTMFSIGKCRCGELRCPGRGICHICYGTGYKWGEKQVVTREWPAEFEKLYGRAA